MPHLLDEKSFVLRNDPKGIYDLTVGFPNNCSESLAIARSAGIAKRAEIRNVLLTGMGGSAAGGDFARAVFESQSSVPFAVNRDYHLPNFASPETLVFACSYSGNTEETLSAYDDAKARGCQIIVISSGGKLTELAGQDGSQIIQIPGGQPPRTALGLMLIPVLVAAEALNLIPAQDYVKAFDLVRTAIAGWTIEIPFEENPAKQLGASLQNKVGVIYGLGSWQGLVAGRWKGQINENAKNLAFPNSFPELNHNEILGWVGAGHQNANGFAAIALQDGQESVKMKQRLQVTQDLIRGVCEVHTASAKGQTLLEKLLTLTSLGDFVSVYLAALNGVDPENIDSINTLKAELAKV